MVRFRKKKTIDDEEDEKDKTYKIKHSQWEKDAIEKGYRILAKARELRIQVSDVDWID